MKIGFIGTGSMGSILIKAFLDAHTFTAENMWISNRTVEKAHAIAREYPGIHVTENIELVHHTDCFFICVKPKEFHSVLHEIAPTSRANQLAISITSPVMLQDLEEWLPCKVAKIIPSITNQAQCGSSLYIPGSRMNPTDEEWLRNTLSTISSPLKVDESHTRIAADLASCAPAFLANLLEHLAHVASRETGIPVDIAEPLVQQMAWGVAKLLNEGIFSYQQLQDRVAVPGGITAEGLRLLDETIPPIFQQLFHLTHKKYREDIQKVKETLQRAPSTQG